MNISLEDLDSEGNVIASISKSWKWGTSKSMLRLNGWIQEFHMGLSEDFNKKNKKNVNKKLFKFGKRLDYE